MIYLTAFLKSYWRKDFKMNKCKFTDGDIYEYESDETGDCYRCAFRNYSRNCVESQEYVDCSDHDIIWLKVKEEPMKLITQEIKEFDVSKLENQVPGTKYDQDKLQYTLIPSKALEAVARNLTIGLKKYKERDNWKKVPNAEQRYLDALYRHLEAHRSGDLYDVDSSDPTMPHMAAVAVNAMFLLEFMLNPELKKG